MPEGSGASPYGVFLDGGQVLGISTPHTPAPWVNYLFNPTYTAYVSQVGQGESQCVYPLRAAVNRGLRAFYLKDEDSGEFFCPLYEPAQTHLDFFACDHALAYSEIKARRGALETRARVFVPVLGENEIWSLSVTNLGTAPVRLSLFSYFPLFDAIDCFAVETRVGPDGAWISAGRTPYFARMDQYPGILRQKQAAALAVDRIPDGWEGSTRAFLGPCGALHYPQAVVNGVLTGRVAMNEDACAAFLHHLHLAGGECFELNLALAAGELTTHANGTLAARARALVAPGRPSAELERVKRFWETAAGRCRVRTPDPDFNAAVNCWVRKQLYFMALTHRMNPAPCLRNELQDIAGFALFEPGAARAALDSVLTAQRSDGYLPHSFQLNELAVLGGIQVLNYQDGPVWLPLTAASLARQLGDVDYLRAPAPFSDDPTPLPAAEHVWRALEYTLAHLGRHGLPLLGAGDWDDPLSGPGSGGQGESSWIGMAWIHAAREYLPVAKALGQPASRLRAGIAQMVNSLNTHAWNGAWYARGFDDDGQPFGSLEDGRRFLNAYSWVLLAKAASPERQTALLNDIETIFDTPCGPFTLSPPYTSLDQRIGKLTMKRAGTMENGSIYNHAAAFLADTECRLGRGGRAYRLLRRMLGTNPENPPVRSLQSPLFIPNFYVGPAEPEAFGRSSLLNSTGSAAWFQQTAIEGILGLRAELGGLRVEPCLPPEWAWAELERELRGTRVRLRVDNPRGVERGVRRMLVNGREESPGTLLVLRGAEMDVRVEMG